MPSGVARSGREEPPEIAQPGRAEQRVADGVERDVAVGMADAAAARRRFDARRARAGSPGPNGWLSCPIPVRPAGRRPTQGAARPAREVGRHVTLRFPGSPGTTWTGMLQASSREASSVQVSGPSGGNRRRPRGAGRAARPAASARRRGRPGRRSPTTTLAVDPLERLRDRHDRDRGAVRAVASATARDERRVDERPRAVVDQDDRRSSSEPCATRAANPAATESWRRLPPATTADDLRPAARRAAAHLGDPLARR